jgi:hypothetical protein
MLYLIGFHDNNNLLRDMLKNYLNGSAANELRERFMIYHKYMDELLSIESEDRILEEVIKKFVFFRFN